MTIGYFIGLGDKTTCGGTVLEGDGRVIMHGLVHACEGHRVSCGKDGRTYQILGGVSYIISHGKRVAGTLDSFSSCGCKARFIPSVFAATYQNESNPAPQATRPAAQTNNTSTKPPSQTPRPGNATAGGACDERFQFFNHRGIPLGLLSYAVLQNDQCIGYGKLDDQGLSCACQSTSPTPLSIVVTAPSPVME